MKREVIFLAIFATWGHLWIDGEEKVVVRDGINVPSDYFRHLPNISYSYIWTPNQGLAERSYDCVLAPGRFYSRIRIPKGDSKWTTLIAVFDGKTYKHFNEESSHLDVSNSFEDLRHLFWGHFEMNPAFNPFAHLIDVSLVSLDGKKGYGFDEALQARLDLWTVESPGRVKVKQASGKSIGLMVGPHGFPVGMSIPWRNENTIQWSVNELFTKGDVVIPQEIEMVCTDPKSVFNYHITLDVESVKVLSGEDIASMQRVFEIPNIVANTVVDHTLARGGK
jgi:hypothetical protein